MLITESLHYQVWRFRVQHGITNDRVRCDHVHGVRGVVIVQHTGLNKVSTYRVTYAAKRIVTLTRRCLDHIHLSKAFEAVPERRDAAAQDTLPVLASDRKVSRAVGGPDFVAQHIRYAGGITGASADGVRADTAASVRRWEVFAIRIIRIGGSSSHGLQTASDGE